MTQSLFKIITFLVGVYALLPTVLARLCHIGVIWQGPRNGRKVAITFDDGPDPTYTPRVLDILKKYGIKACFFVLGYKARAYPELITRMVAEGHEVASHGFRHHFPWFLGPRALFREVRESSRVIADITGRPPRLYRPPWGLFNLFSLLHSHLFGQRVVLWSFMSWDWGRRCTPESITRQVLSRVREGSILVFHDSDDTPGAASGAPEKMLAALPLIIEGLRQRGFSVAPLAELYAPRKNFWQRLGQKIDSLVVRLSGIEDLYHEGRSTLFRLRVKRFRGRTLKLSDGTLLRSRDPIAELHLNNEILQEITRTGKSPERIALLALKEARRSLPALARWASNAPQGKEIRAVLGLTMLYRGAERLGFTICDPPALLKKLATWYQGWLLGLYRPEGRLRYYRHRDKLSPKIVAMGREELIRRYLQASGDNPGTFYRGEE
jgi:peptidoglycan/xylan/chitin deacetylase (PgdA/CDA1 family)